MDDIEEILDLGHDSWFSKATEGQQADYLYGPDGIYIGYDDDE